MQLNLQTDYALRLLIFLASCEPSSRLASTGDIAEVYDISANHLGKVTAKLSDLGYIETVRGRSGGIRLAKPPSEIGIGQVIRQTEPQFELTECMGESSDCTLEPVCQLRGVLLEARRDFLARLEDFTLADVTENQHALQRVLGCPGAQMV